jgi:hypothetical protein
VPDLLRSYFLSFAACLLAVCSGCSKPETPALPDATADTSSSPPAISPGKLSLDPCSLLTSDEIKEIQGEAPQNVKSTAPSEGELSSSQCFFELPGFVNSISLQVVQKGSKPGGPDAKQAWNKMFPPEKLQERETEAGKKKLPARPILELGEAAFWTGGPAGGLYVLQGSHYIRLSVGGEGNEETKIGKSTALARLVLKRL